MVIDSEAKILDKWRPVQFLAKFEKVILTDLSQSGADPLHGISIHSDIKMPLRSGSAH